MEDRKGVARPNGPARHAWRGVFGTAARALAAGVLAIGVAHAQDPAAEDSVGAIRNAYYSLRAVAASKQVQVTPGEVLELVDRCWKIYDKSAGEPEEFDALVEVLSLTSNGDLHHPKLDEHWRDALGKMEKDHVDDKRMAGFIMYPPAPPQLKGEVEKFLKNVEANTKSPDVKAAFEYKTLSPLIEQQGDGQLDDAKTAELVGKLKDMAARYPDAAVPNDGRTYKEWVANRIRIIESLKIGNLAPEITGQDLDGVAFKLSDYRGKVVMLDFWGYW